MVITFIASILIWLMFFGLIVLWVIDGKKKKEIVLHSLLSCFIAWIISEMFKEFLPIPRPYMENGLLPLTISIPGDGAFPSTHTAVGFALSVSIIKHHKRVGILYILMAGLIGIARIVANVHYPIDIIGGAILGTTVSLLFGRIHPIKIK